MMLRVDLPFYFSPFAETSIDPIRLFSLHAYRSRVSIASAGNDLPQFTPKLSVVGGFFCETRWWRKCMDKSAGMKLRRDDGEDVDAPAVSLYFFRQSYPSRVRDSLATFALITAANLRHRLAWKTWTLYGRCLHYSALVTYVFQFRKRILILSDVFVELYDVIMRVF